MKGIYSAFIFVAVLLLVSGCKKEDDAFEEQLVTGTELMEVGSRVGNYQFDVLSNRDMTVEADVDWIQLDSNFLPKGKHQLGFLVAKNEGDERTGMITVRINEELTKQILVAQESGKVPVFFVRPSGTGDGSSWAEATGFATAMQQAVSGSTIYLMEGVYTPNQTIRNGESTEESDQTFEITKNVSIIGGFSNEAQEGDAPDPAVHPTILDGKFASGKQAFHTLSITATKETDLQVNLENLQITGGKATDRSTVININGLAFSRGQGGGVVIGGSRVHMKNVDIIENQASSDGGTAGFAAGLYAFSSAELVMENCKVNNNSNLNNNGGGVWIHESDLTAYDSQFNENYARGTAGGVHGYPNAKVVLYNSEVSHNSNTSYGAGLYMRDGSDAILVNCLLVGNTSTSGNGGGAVMLYAGSRADIISSTLTANEIAGPGAGVYRQSGVNNLTVINSIISGNTQSSSSTDVDAHADNQNIIPEIKNATIQDQVYGDSGTVIAGVGFNPLTMLSPAYLPIGADNPAMNYGLDAAGLTRVSESYSPVLEDRVQADKNGNARSETVMGALVQ